MAVGDSYNLDANGNYRYPKSRLTIGDQDQKGKQPPPPPPPPVLPSRVPFLEKLGIPSAPPLDGGHLAPALDIGTFGPVQSLPAEPESNIKPKAEPPSPLPWWVPANRILEPGSPEAERPERYILRNPPPMYEHPDIASQRPAGNLNPDFYLWAREAADGYLETTPEQRLAIQNWLSNQNKEFLTDYWGSPKAKQRIENAWRGADFGELGGSNFSPLLREFGFLNTQGGTDAILEGLRDRAAGTQVFVANKDNPNTRNLELQLFKRGSMGSVTNSGGVLLFPDTDILWGHHYGDVDTHERTHNAQGIMNMGGQFYNPVPKHQWEALARYRNPKLKPNSDSDSYAWEPVEIYADLMAIRNLAFQLGIHDARTQDFDEDLLSAMQEKLKASNTSSAQLNRLLRYFGKNGVVWAMNNLAQNNQKSTIPDNYA